MLSASALLLFLPLSVRAQQIVNGQIYTPGIAIVDAPQPNTPLGGGEFLPPVPYFSPFLTKLDFLQVALDVSSDGQLQLPPYPSNSVSAIYNITLFLSSYTTGLNLTISNGTATPNNASLGEIMTQENGSTVKHVNWVWPDCLVGDGTPSGNSSRGLYNISIRQNFRLNGTDAYTIFDLPIQVTNSIPADDKRASCDSLNNALRTQEALVVSANNFTRIAGTAIQENDGSGGGGQGLGAGEMLSWKGACHWVWVGGAALMLLS